MLLAPRREEQHTETDSDAESCRRKRAADIDADSKELMGYLVEKRLELVPELAKSRFPA